MESIAKRMKMRFTKRVAQRVIEGKAFVLDTKAKSLHSFNPTGTRIWELAGRGETIDSIAAAIAEEFEVGLADATKDVTAFLDDLRAKELVEER